MRAVLVPDKLTPVTAKEAALALRSAFETVLGRTPSNACLALLTAQSALETGRWKSIHCFNMGNSKASQDYTGHYCQFRCNEVERDENGHERTVWYDPPHMQTSFRAFDSLESGAIDHLRFLSGRARYAKAWAVLQTGMPLAFVEALAAAGYFTADPKPYGRAVASLWNEFLPMVGTLREPEPHPEREVDEELHTEALAIVSRFDPTEAAREERREAMGEA